MNTTLTPIRQKRLDDLRQLSNHGGRDQWHGLHCHHIRNGQFTATYSDIAARWGVKPSVVYSTIKRFIKLGLIATERFERATLFTLIDPTNSTDARLTRPDYQNNAKQERSNRRGMSKPLFNWQNKNAPTHVKLKKHFNGHPIRIIPQHRAAFRAHRRRT